MFQLRICRNISRKYLFGPLRPLNNKPADSILFSSQSFSNDYGGKVMFKGTPKDKLHWKASKFSNATPSAAFSDPEPIESEKEFLVQAKLDPDHFGPPEMKEIDTFIDEGDILEEKHISEKPPGHKRLTTKQYADIIKGLIKQRKIKEAIDILEERMLKEDRVKPENYIYNLLLGACGRVGYTKKAFMLYNDMKKRGLKVMGGTYTALFNACANSPWPTTDGLSRAKHLYNIMIEKGDEPNDTTYNAMIKAFGRCGDLPMAFSLVDAKAHKGFPIKDDTINFLLQACISDTESGFRHSLLVWRKLVEKNIKPSIYTFNLLLRCVRDCGLGDLETTNDVIKRLVDKNDEQSKPLQIQAKDNNTGSTGNNFDSSSSIIDKEDSLEKSDYKGPEVKNVLQCNPLLRDVRPNLLSQKPHLGSTLIISEINKPEDRLLLIGGCKGFLATMEEYQCIPDIKTFTQLLDCIPSTQAAEKELISAIRRLKVNPDVDFYNMLIKKMSMRFEYDEAKKVLISLKQQKMRPNLVTFGVLALGCKTRDEANELLNEMKSCGYTLNAAILGTMLHQACYHMAFDYIFEIMEMCLRESVPVTKKFLEHLDGFKEQCRAKLDAKSLNKKEVKLFGIFKARHKTWLTEVQIDETEEAHPWQQYRQTYPGDVHIKPKDTARFKPRRQSLFRVKTSRKHKNRK
ncbi:pentatricopeptide repeat-containing protein 1, mitochondrial [Anthonomus grandis grandis]|uniref:pentatricopeptide repeat-containing protein 1, mitochondrial n=1 Tax=Anthonomus grandis grandis TaxID=2921223 RepID=UPI00216552F7|nr:pentatricopeptide repeat-containing protein 1, mitochondrial [Anthonomus grandis grandis]